MIIALSDAAWTQLFITLGAVAMVWMQLRSKRTLDTVHKLVNSGALAQYKINAELSRWKADRGTNPDHIREAEEAEKLYQEHKAKQNKVDAG